MFKNTLPDPLLDYTHLHELLVPVASVLMIAGLWGAVVRAQSGRELLLILARTATIVALLLNLTRLGNAAQAYLQNIIVTELKADPAKVGEKYVNAFLKAKKDAAQKESWWARLTKAPMLIFEGVLVAIILIASLLTAIIAFLGYVVQKVILQMGYALAPLFVAFLMLSSVRSIGVQFLLSLSGVILWPLGWAVCSLVTDKLINHATDQSLLVEPLTAGSLAYAARNLVSSLLLAVWIIGSTLAAPWAIQRAVTTGAQVGTGLLAAARSTPRLR